MSRIAFYGVGNMGFHMAHNLLKSGHEVCAFDLVPELLNGIQEQGATIADDTTKALDEVDFVISMLPSARAVEGLYLAEGFFEAVPKNALIIDCSTVSAETSRDLAKQAQAKGVAVIDAPVSGGVGGAEAGTLTFICGGAEQDVDNAKSILADMGKNIFRAGDSGAGQIAKICNNMLLAVHMAGTAEALQMGVNNGLDPKVMSDIMMQSSGRNWSLELYNPFPGVMDNVPASREYEGGFLVNLMLKDLGLALNTAENSASKTPMGKLAKSLYATHADEGHGLLDFSSIQKLFAIST